MGFINYLCCCFEVIFDCFSCFFRSKENRKPSLSDFLSDSGGDQSLRKKSNVELIKIDDEKSSLELKFEHKDPKPRLGLVIPESFDRLDKRLEKDHQDETLIQIYQKLSPAAISEKISEELWTNGSKITNERFKSFLILSIELYNNEKINQDKLISIFMNSLGELAESGSTEKFKLLLSAIRSNFKVDQVDSFLISNCLLAISESGSIKILEELMSFISQFRKSDQEYILKAYPLALKVAVKNGHTDFIKELTDYFSQILSDDRSFFERAKTEAIIKVKSLYDAPKNQEEILKTLESLKYEVPQKDVIIDLTTALTTTAPEPVLSIREALQTSPPTDLSNPQESTVDQIGDLEGSSMYVY